MRTDLVIGGFEEAEDDVPAMKLREVWYIYGAHVKAVCLAHIRRSHIVFAPFCSKIRNMQYVIIIPVLIRRLINNLLPHDAGPNNVFGKHNNLDGFDGCINEYSRRTASFFRAARCFLRVSAAAGRVVACHLGFGKLSGRFLTAEGYNWIRGITGLIYIEIEIAYTVANFVFFFNSTLIYIEIKMAYIVANFRFFFNSTDTRSLRA